MGSPAMLPQERSPCKTFLDKKQSYPGSTATAYCRRDLLSLEALRRTLSVLGVPCFLLLRGALVRASSREAAGYVSRLQSRRRSVPSIAPQTRDTLEAGLPGHTHSTL